VVGGAARTAELRTDPATGRHQGTEGDHAGGPGGAQRGPEPACDGPGTQVVHADLQVEAVGGTGVRVAGAGAGIVHQQVHRLVGQSGREVGDADQRAEFDELHPDLCLRMDPGDPGRGGLAPGLVANRQHDLGARSGERGRGGEPDAAARPGDNGTPAGQVGQDERGQPVGDATGPAHPCRLWIAAHSSRSPTVRWKSSAWSGSWAK